MRLKSTFSHLFRGEEHVRQFVLDSVLLGHVFLNHPRTALAARVAATPTEATNVHADRVPARNLGYSPEKSARNCKIAS